VVRVPSATSKGPGELTISKFRGTSESFEKIVYNLAILKIVSKIRAI